jgi:hypothetical protein
MLRKTSEESNPTENCADKMPFRLMLYLVLATPTTLSRFPYAYLYITYVKGATQEKDINKILSKQEEVYKTTLSTL